MNTPIYDFVSEYAEKNYVRAHMPGHKGASDGNAISAVYPYDITEIGGADSLFEANGIIAESEKNAAELFHTDGTFYSAGGSTLCIQSMLAMVCKSGDTVVAARNSHRRNGTPPQLPLYPQYFPDSRERLYKRRQPPQR